jgi:hypothetical protein
MLFFVYVGIGVLFGFIRWSQYVEAELNFYESERLRFMYFHRIRGEEIPEYLKPEWRIHVAKDERLKAVPPDIHEHYGEVGFDVIAWPLSLLALAVLSVYTVFMKHILIKFNRATTQKLARISRDLKGR